MTRVDLKFTAFSNGSAVHLKNVPELPPDGFSRNIIDAVSAGMRVSALFGVPSQKNNATWLFVVLSDDEHNKLFAGRTEITGAGFRSITECCPQVHLFEREIAEQFGLVPDGHPWMKPVRYHASWTEHDAWSRSKQGRILPAVGDFLQITRDAHEVSVGPVHAGVIEPGHFRFQCFGEEVHHLEIALGFQHRGIEQAVIGGPSKKSLHYMETLAGDTTIAHASAYNGIVESLAKSKKSARAQVLGGIALELERLANHTGDLGALSGDVGFLPTSSFCGRIRGDFLNMTALLCGSRFGRGMIRQGGVGFDIDESIASELKRRLDTAEKETAAAVNLLWDAQSVMARFVDTGILPRNIAEELGIVGPAARASGLLRDTRFNQPSGIFRMVQIPVSTYDSGDVFARAFVRWMEILRSIAFIREQLGSIPSGAIRSDIKSFAPDSLAVCLVEGWRGEVCHVSITDKLGRFSRYKIVDPSFHNWQGLAYAMRGQDISDFPLCNKSFNLSYCVHDL